MLEWNKKIDSNEWTTTFGPFIATVHQCDATEFLVHLQSSICRETNSWVTANNVTQALKQAEWFMATELKRFEDTLTNTISSTQELYEQSSKWSEELEKARNDLPDPWKVNQRVGCDEWVLSEAHPRVTIQPLFHTFSLCVNKTKVSDHPTLADAKHAGEFELWERVRHDAESASISARDAQIRKENVEKLLGLTPS